MDNNKKNLQQLGSSILFRATEVTMNTVSKFNQLEIAIMMIIFDTLGSKDVADIDTMTIISGIFAPGGIESLKGDLEANGVETTEKEVFNAASAVFASFFESGLIYHVGMAATRGIDINPPKKISKFEDLGIQDPFKE